MTLSTATSIGTTVRLKTDFSSALARVTTALKTEGFGVLTEIDVQQTLKAKLGVDFQPYKILGACNPPLAYRALTTAPESGFLLPCNVTVSQVEDGMIQVMIVDPMAMLNIVNNPELKSIAEEAQARLERVAAALQESA
jgi:uncharacterized protein (DUF302 family)